VTQIGTVLGTLRYLAPEQADGREVGPPADVYSLGVVFDELLERKPRDVTRILERARADAPRKRPAADEVAAALRGGPAPTTATAVTRVLVRRHVARRYWPALAMALLLAAVAVGLAIGSGSPSKPARTAPVRIPPVPHSADAAQEARNLSVWLQRYSK
jgi:serine/threonine protein kinase